MFLFVIQVAIAWAMLYATWAARRNWDEMLGPEKVLPGLTTAALSFGFMIPAVAAVASLVVAYIDWRRGSSRPVWLFVVATCESLFMALFALGLTMPALFITYRLGS